jgi:hypothetical protein
MPLSALSTMPIKVQDNKFELTVWQVWQQNDEYIIDVNSVCSKILLYNNQRWYQDLVIEGSYRPKKNMK